MPRRYIWYQALAALSPMTIGCGSTAVVPLGLIVLVPRGKETAMLEGEPASTMWLAVYAPALCRY